MYWRRGGGDTPTLVDGCALATQTTANVLQFFAVRTLKHDAVPGSAAGGGSRDSGQQPELKRMELFLERSTVIEGTAMAADIVGDSRAVVVSRPRPPPPSSPPPTHTHTCVRAHALGREQHAIFLSCDTSAYEVRPEIPG